MERTPEQRKEHAKQMRIYWANNPKFRKNQLKKAKIWRKSHIKELKDYRTDYYHDNKSYLDKQNQDWFDKNYPHALKLQRKRTHNYEQRIKTIILKHYSKGKLKCLECDEKIFRFLTIHHINGRKVEGHSRKMTGNTLYRWLKIHKFPKGYQTLCYNCNCRMEFSKDIEIPKEFTDKYQKFYYNTLLPKAEKAKLECINHYTRGKNTCQCCGEKNIDNLTIDHIDGRKEVKHSPKQGGIKLWVWLQVHNFPKGFQILCYNCNSARGNYGICPHKE